MTTTPPAPDAALVVVEGLSKRFGDIDALRELSFQLAPGEVVGLLGPNGAGKTTTMRLLLGLLRPSSGTARVLGHDCARDTLEVKRVLGYVPDEPAFYDFLTGRETLEFVLSMRDLHGPHSLDWALEFARLLDLERDLDRRVAGYSLGMRKKLAFLTAIAHRPGVLLLDEPTNGLDPPSAVLAREAITRLAAQGAAVLLSTHMLELADRLCTRLMLIDRGKLVAQGTPTQVRTLANLPTDASLEASFLAVVAHRAQ